ncbi:structural maintenance of chromosomes protein 3-like [Dermacentor silvarum]|uniref:structural maintenance of chromosomes protein 3-like n=1 Tax=Dermacentor silvarum TaxID=543639 RepID=UPI0018991941|nr:structural maintenance of chromosomes protein 3-like [Dermacentor silvarum]
MGCEEDLGEHSLTHLLVLCRSLEYTIYDHELKDTKKKLEELETRRESSSSVAEKLRENLQNAAEKIKKLSKELREVKSRAQAQREERRPCRGAVVGAQGEDPPGADH